MATLSSLIQDFQNRKNDLAQAAVDSFNETSEDWVDLNRNQMLHGLNSDGTQIGQYASPVYSEVKFRMNELAGEGNVDLRLTGAFQDAEYAIAVGKKITSNSSDYKNQMLEKKYGKKIHGLNLENKKVYTFGPYWSVLRQKLDL